LLPFVAPAQVRRVSRASAERHLRTLLGVGQEGEPTPWAITEQPPPEDPESHLEQRFRKVLVERLKTLGAAVTEVPGALGNAVRFTLPGQHRRWTVSPQVNLENTKPDFVLETDDTAVPAVAIFTDGRAFHATVAHNRLADDAAKRQILRDTGRIVLAITAADVQEAEQGTNTPPAWFAESMVQQLINKQPFMATPAAYAGLGNGPIGWLIDWISAPAPANLQKVSRAVPMFLLAPATAALLPEGLSLEDAARLVLLGDALPTAGTRPVQIWRSGACAMAIEPTGSTINTALLLDDRDGTVDAAHVESWQQWLRLSNALALRDWPTVITTTSRSAAPTAAPAPSPTPAEATAEMPPEWAAAYAKASAGQERDLVRALAERDGLTPPEVGDEGPDGIVVDLSWPLLHVAVALATMPAEDRNDLEAAGWRVVEASPDAIAAALAGIVPGGES
jgi:hypothetical protein